MHTNRASDSDQNVALLRYVARFLAADIGLDIGLEVYAMERKKSIIDRAGNAE